jgi:hypothetical protein
VKILLFEKSQKFGFAQAGADRDIEVGLGVGVVLASYVPMMRYCRIAFSRSDKCGTGIFPQT